MVDDHSDAVAVAAAVRTGSVSAHEVVAAAIARVQVADRRYSFLVAERFDRALEEAMRVDLSAALAGVPILMKDYLATVSGMPQTEGSAFIRDWVADHDSNYVARLRRAGAIILGSVTTLEMALLSTCESSRYGKTRNPVSPTRTTGGSSGGSASAVASYAVPAAHGSDVGGSIRIPASCCGLIGLKPTRARNSLGPDHGDLGGGLWVEHMLTRTVRDSAAFLDATAGPASGDPYPAPPPGGGYLQSVNDPPRRLRVTVSINALNGQAPHPDCAAAVEHTAQLIADLGHDVEYAAPAFDVERAEDAFFTILCAGLAARVDLWSHRLGREPLEDELEPYTWGLLERGRSAWGRDVVASLDRMQHESRRIAAFYEGCDVWLTPTLGSPSVPLGYFDLRPGESVADILNRDADFTAYLWMANMTGQPAMSFPAFTGSDGAPIGVQLTARFGREDVLFNLAGALERAGTRTPGPS